MIIQKSRTDGLWKVDGNFYKCEIIGDGIMQHFGINFPDEIPAKIRVKCTK